MTSWLPEPVGQASGPEGAGRHWEPYPAYKDSGIEWLGSVPKEWNVRRLKYAASFVTTRTAGSDDCTYIALEHLESGTGRIVDSLPTDETESTPVAFKAGDVLFGKLRPYLAKVAAPGFSGCCSSELVVLRPSPNVSQRFLFYQLISTGFIKWIDSLTYGAKMPRVSIEKLADSQIAVPSIGTQRDIASFLDRETGRIEDLIAKKQRLIELLEEKRTALITRAVTKGLEPEVPMKDSGIKWLGEIPGHWDTVSLRTLSPNITVGIVVRPAKHYVSDGVPCIRSQNVKAGRVDEDNLVYISEQSNNEMEKSQIFEGDLVVVRTGDPGTTAVVPSAFDRANCIDLVIVRKPDLADESWLCWFLNSAAAEIQYRMSSGGTAQQHLNVGAVRRIRVPVPSLREQHQISSYISTRSQKLHRLKEALERGIDRLDEYRSVLIFAAVTGSIDVRHWVP